MNPKFLVVDDDSDTLALIDAMLSALGCETKSVNNGELALEELSSPEKAHCFDAVFLDIMMPGMNGYQVLEWIRKQPYLEALPVVMLTAKSAGEDIISGYQNGADYYITKPFTKSQLVYGLDIILGSGPTEEDAENIPVLEIPEE